MFELRIYDRRPSCLARFRHGGYAAIAPVEQRSVMDVTTAMTGTGDIAVSADVQETAKVLLFPVQSDRPGRKQNGRPKVRAKGRKKS
ncbi:MAG: hypothetical protein GKS00_17980 [Alphaproteobacteria bacterium]|nr:hypothetical protein [Alphaproteobacteria bacterium]